MLRGGEASKRKALERRASILKGEKFGMDFGDAS